MTKWTCGMPELAEEEDCPIDTGEIEECEECFWGVEKEVDW